MSRRNRAAGAAIAVFVLVAPAGAQRVYASTAAEGHLVARLIRMADGRTLDTALVDEALGSRFRWARAQATLAVGQVAGQARLGRLRALLNDGDTAVAANAAFSLGLVKDTASIAALGAALRAARGVATEAAWSLGEIGAPARGVIEGALRGAPLGAATQSTLLRAAAKLRPVPTRIVVEYLTTSNRDVRWSAAYAIARPRALDGIRALLPLARDTAAGIRALVAGALAKGTAGDSLGEIARTALRALIADRDHLVRTNAVRSLATYGTPERAAVLAAFRDPDVNVRVAAAQSVRPAIDSAPAEWERLWNADTSYMVRRSLLESAARAGRTLDAVPTWASSPDWRLRAAAVEAAATAVPAARRFAVTRRALDDEDGRVRVAAAGAVASVADSAVAGVDVRTALIGLLSDRDPGVRATVIGALRRHARVAEVARILQAYREAFEDEENDARVAALRFIAASWKQDSASWGAAERASLAALPIPPDPLESAEVKDVGPLAAWRGTEPQVRDIAFYDSVVRAIVVPSRANRPARARIVTERGDLVLTLFGADAPLTVRNFLDLARRGYYKGTRFHRVVPNFVAQDGDPRGDGSGGPGYAIRDEFNRRRYDRGSLGMALSGPDTGGSQYFLAHAPQPHLDGHYTVFGWLSAGDAVLDRIVQGDRIVDVQVLP